MAEPPPAAFGPAPVAYEAGPATVPWSPQLPPALGSRTAAPRTFNIPPQNRMHGADAVPCAYVRVHPKESSGPGAGCGECVRAHSAQTVGLSCNGDAAPVRPGTPVHHE